MRIEQAQAAMTTALQGWLTRAQAVTVSRMQGPRARRDTKWWRAQTEPAREVKAVDSTYVLPQKLVDEVREALMPVGRKIAVDAATAAARRMGVRVDPVGDSMLSLDTSTLERAITQAVEEIVSVATRQAQEIRRSIGAADRSAESLDEVISHIEAAYRRSGNWVLMSGRTLATALTSEAAMLQARALGATHSQWLSERDEAVRHAHRVADGQVRAIGSKFKVGSFGVRFPGDPQDLPASWPMVANCRCGLLFNKAPAGRAAPLKTITTQAAAHAGQVPGPAARLLDALAAAPPGEPVRTVEPVVLYRRLPAALDAVGGQRIDLPAATGWSLRPPSTWSAAVPVLALLVGTDVAAQVGKGAAGVVVLPDAQELEVLASGPTGTQAQTVQTVQTGPAAA
jgi:hypothetical protein